MIENLVIMLKYVVAYLGGGRGVDKCQNWVTYGIGKLYFK